MLNAIVQYEPTVPETNPGDNRWVRIFDPYAAVKSVFNHVEKLASSRTTRHTARQYRICLYDYLEYCGAIISRDQADTTRMTGDTFDFTAMRLHTPDQIGEYLVYCLNMGRSSKTIGKYLAPIHLYLNALRKQPFIGLTGEIRYLILDAKEMFEMAAQVDPPPAETKSSQSAGQRGVRLNLTQVNEYLTQIDRATLSGKRDTAIFYTALISMLRVSEIARMRLRDIRPGDTTPYEIKVIGKRNNTDPVGIDQRAYDLIMEYVEAFNSGLADGDPRRITPETPLWQPLRSGDHYIDPDADWYDPMRGIKPNAIRRMLRRRTPPVVNQQIGQDGIRPHDLRRTTALGLAEQNVPIPAIQRQARHANAQTTSEYIGHFTDLSKGLLSNHWTIRLGPIQPALA